LYPALYQINTRVRLSELSRSLGRAATLEESLSTGSRSRVPSAAGAGTELPAGTASNTARKKDLMSSLWIHCGSTGGRGIPIGTSAEAGSPIAGLLGRHRDPTVTSCYIARSQCSRRPREVYVSHSPAASSLF